MNIHSHTLTGCAPTPLASYLKALGILRLVSEQADPAARGAWRDESFILATKLNSEELAEFFLTQYAPTPLISPWNGGSGFLGKDALLEQFEQSSLPRLQVYQQGIKAARALCDDLSAAKQKIATIKDEPKKLPTAAREGLRSDPDYKARLSSADRDFKRLKESFIPACRLSWRGPHLEWLDAAVILKTDYSAAYPALLGSGGNDGNFDFTNNFRQRFTDLFDIAKAGTPVPEKTRALLSHALFGSAVLGTGSYPIGQYAPGVAGGANSSTGLEGKTNVNPWDFILFLEGTVLFAAAASRRLKSGQVGSGSAPFALMAQSAGHMSSSTGDKSTRGEQWMPLWSQFASLGEIRSLLGEGRVQLGRSSTREPLEMARAVARLGTVRGINAFERYAFLERNGQANFAVPLGRWRVSSQPHQELLADLDAWLVHLHREARSDKASSSLVTAVKQMDDTLLEVTANASIPLHWQNILLAIANLDLLAAQGVLTNAGLVSSLRPEWISVADDGSPEFRLALALASQYGVRRHWLPLNRFGRLDSSGATSVVCFGHNFTADAIALINRRLVESAIDARKLDQTPIRSEFAANLHDVATFLQGALNHNRILCLARAFMALNIKALKEAKHIHLSPPDDSAFIEDSFALFRFCLPPKNWHSTIPVRADIFRRLAANDISTAARQASGHLRAHGVIAPIRIAVGNARLLAASMAFPLSSQTEKQLQRVFLSIM